MKGTITMEKQELERIVDEYCDTLRTNMKKNLQHFHSDWNGYHVRAMAMMMSNDDRVKKAMREIKRSMSYYAMTF